MSQTTYMMCKESTLEEAERGFNSLWTEGEQRRFVKALEKKATQLRSRIGKPPVECRCCGEKTHIAGLCCDCMRAVYGATKPTPG